MKQQDQKKSRTFLDENVQNHGTGERAYPERAREAERI
jgi:hypothetical protein